MKKIIFWIFIALNLGVVGYFWWQGSAPLLGVDLAGTLIAVGRLAGLLAAFFILLQFLLIGRNPWLNGIFGLDRLTRIHHWNGYFAFGFLLVHPFFIMYGYALSAGLDYLTQLQGFLSNYEDGATTVLAFLLYCVIVTSSIVIARTRMKYEAWYGVHLAVYAAALLGFGHQLDLGSTVGGNMAFYYYWISLYLIVFSNLLLFRFIRPLWLFYKYRFFVTRVVRETHEVVSIYIAGKNMQDFKVRAGQFMIFRFLARGFWTQSHPFSLSWIPKNGELRISCKNSGDYTSKLPNLMPGAPVIIEGPFGVFTSEKIKGNKVLLIAGGIGITPIRSLFEELAPTDDVVLMYANKTEADIALRAELEGIAQRNQRKIFHIIADQPDFVGERGRIDMECIRRLIPDFAQREIFICGPPAMLLSIKKQLRVAGVSRARLHYELFSL